MADGEVILTRSHVEFWRSDEHRNLILRELVRRGIADLYLVGLVFFQKKSLTTRCAHAKCKELLFNAGLAIVRGNAAGMFLTGSHQGGAGLIGPYVRPF